MKRIIKALFILIFPISHFGQSFEIDWGQEFKQQGLDKVDQKMIGQTDNFYYVLNRPQKEKELFQFSFDHKLIKVASLDFRYEGKKIEIKRIINTASHSFLLGSSEHKKKKLAYLHFSKLKPNGEVRQEMTPLFSYNFKRNDFFIADYQKNKDAVGITISQDSTKVLFAFVGRTKEGKKKKGNETYQLFVFDDKMEKLWEKKVEFPYGDKEITIEQFEVSNEGEVFFLANTKAEEKRKFPLPSYDYKLFKVSQEQPLQSIKIEPKDGFPSKSFLIHSKDGDVFVCGFFAKKGKKELLKEHGVFITKYNPTFEEEMESLHLWERDFYIQLKEKYNIEAKKSRYIYDFHIGNVIVDYNSRTITFLVEHRYSKKDKEDNQIYHNTNSLIIPSLSFDGNLNWMTCINKDYSINEDETSASSYVVGYKNENIYLIFNDDKTFKETKAMNLGRKFLIANFTEIVQINEKGEVKTNELFFTSKDVGGLFFRPQFSKFVNQKDFILQCTNNKKSLFGTFSIP